MYSSLMLPDRSRLRLLESWPRFAAASGERRRPMPAPGGQAGSARREAEADESLVGRVQQASLLVRSVPRIPLSTSDIKSGEQIWS